MKTRTIVMLVIIAAAVLALSACDGLWGEAPLTDSQRAAAFISDANTSPRDPDDLRSHFHPTLVNEYVAMNDADYWNVLTFFADVDAPFSLSGLSAGGAVPGYDGTTSLSGTVTNGIDASYPIQIGFVGDPLNAENRLIRVIIVEVGDGDTIQNIR